MATVDANVPVNGNYAHQGFEPVANNFVAAGANSANAYAATQQPAASQSAAGAPTSEIPKDEVGWYFVEQYYTTLSKTPDKLYLFYNKRSQFVSGTEEDKIQVNVGQKAINDQIKNLDFHDTKVRVTNVDSQGSDANIVIQVIGEISNRGQPHKRFVQTFVLAEQTNGYFVLNDIFRYLAEEPEDEEELQQEPAVAPAGTQEPAPTAAEPETQVANQGDELARSEEDLVKVDHKLEESVQPEPAKEASPPPAAVNGTPVPEDAEVVEAEEAPAAAVSIPEEASSKQPEAPVAEEVLEAEKPKDPTPTPVVAPQKPAATPAPPKAAVPRTWASLAASAHKVATPAVSIPANGPASSQPKAAAQAPSQPSAAPSAPAAQTAASARDASPATSQGEAAGWQTATSHKKEQSRAQNQAPAAEAEPKRAYIKNVYSQVEENSLRSVLSKFGEVQYLDISRPRNCAFVDFKTNAAFEAAVKANPHHVNGVDLLVEERRVRPQSFAPYPRGGTRGGRGGINQAPRGNFTPRGRGGVARGGRPAPQEA